MIQAVLLSRHPLLYKECLYISRCLCVSVFRELAKNTPRGMCEKWGESLHLPKFGPLLYFCTFLLLYFCTFSFGWTVHINFDAKSGVCSSKTDRVMSTFLLMYFFVLFVLLYFYNLSGQSIRTSMQNLESVAQKMTELLHNYIIIT